MSGVLLQSLGWALVHLLWQGTLVASMLALALLLVGRKSARARYGLACGALVLMLALPVATGWNHYATSRQAAVTSSRAAASEAEEPTPEPLAAAAVASYKKAHAPSEDSLLVRVASLAGEHMPWLVLAWGLGVMACSLRLLGGWLRLRRLVREAEPAPLEWQQRVDALVHKLGVPRVVRLLKSAAVEVPSAAGWLRPVVLLPVSTLSGLSTRQLEMILAHELAHIRRHDFAINLVQTLVETLLFYHPAVWWVSHVIRVERENCCDDIAVKASGSSVSYARALTALETLRITPMEAGPIVEALAPSALGGSLPERVRRLVAAPPSRCSSRWVAGASVLTLISSVAVAAPLAVLALPPQPPAPVALVQRLNNPAVIAPVPGALPTPPSLPSPSTPPSAMPGVLPLPSPVLAANPNPNPNPHPNPHPHVAGRDDDDEGDEDDRTPVDGKLSVDQLVSLKVAGVTPELVQKLSAAGIEPTVGNLTGLGHAGVTPEYIQEMNTRFGRKLTADELAQMKHLGVTPEYMEAMKAAGYGNASVDDLVSARAVGVNPDYLRQMQAAGFTKLSLEDLTQLRAVGVTPEYLAELGKLGFTKLDAEDATQLRALGINAGYVRSLQEAGLKNLSTEQLTELKAVGVSADFVRQMRDAGLEPLSVDELVRLRTSGVDADFIQRLKKSGK